jgi:predicted flap endonuclease-1-like 5' DNA nuclease
VKPPKRGGGLQAFSLILQAPIQAVLKAIDDAKVRREVEAQYEEYRRTGKVRATLGEDDRVVRALYAAEVLKTPLSSLDARWPREIGAKAGEGAPARAISRKAKAAPPQPRPARRQPRVIDLGPPKPALAVVKPTQAARPVKAPRELPAGAPLAKREKNLPRFTLSGDAPVVQAPSIGPKTARRLETLGVKTIADLLALEPEQGEAAIDAGHISAQTIRDWQAQALLACTVPGLKSREAQALAACGVKDAVDLARRDAVELCDAVARWGLSEEGQRAWGNAPAPNEDDVATWIARAKRVAQTGGAPVAA